MRLKNRETGNVRRSKSLGKPVSLLSAVAILATLTLQMSGCRSQEKQQPMSSAEAKEVAVDLIAKPVKLPPRSLAGLTPLPRNLSEVSDSAECVVPAPTLTAQRITAMQASFYGSGLAYQYRRRAQKALRKGRLSDAIRIQRRAIKEADHRDDYAADHIFLATYLAKAGDFYTAQTLFDSGVSALLSIDNSAYPSCQIRDSYWINRGKGMIAFAKGNLRKSETFFLQAQHHVARLAEKAALCEPVGPWLTAELVLGQAQTVLWQGRTLEAEALAREAYRKSGLIRPEAMILLSNIFFEQGRFNDSFQVALGAIKRLDQSCAASDALLRGRAYEAVGRALVGLQRWDQAAEAFAKLESLMRTDPEIWNNRFRVNRDRGIVLLRTGRAAEAKRVLADIAEEQTRRLGKDNYQTLETRAFFAVALAETGETAEALVEMRRAVPVLLNRWREGSGNSANLIGRMFRLRLIAESYLKLLLDPGNRGDRLNSELVAEAFEIAEAVGTRGVQRALTESTARSLAKDPVTEGLVRQSQDLERQLTAFRYRLNEAYGSRDSVKKEVLDVLAGEIKAAERVLRRLERDIASEFPEYSALSNPEPVTVLDARESLYPGETLILTFVGEQRTFVWAVPKKGHAIATVSLVGQKQLKREIDELRSSLAPDVATLADIPTFDIDLGYRLFKEVLAPLEPAWRKNSQLLVVSDGPLGTIPIGVLPTAKTTLKADETVLFDSYRGVSWLARSHAIARLPSVASLIALRRSVERPMARYAFVGFGDPRFSQQNTGAAKSDTRSATRSRGAKINPLALRNLSVTRSANSLTLNDLPRLPDTADEIIAISEALDANLDRDVYLGIRASERRVKELSEKGELKKYRTLSFATHGLVPGDLDGLTKPALALSQPTPQEAALGDDGLLTSDEILGLRLNADWAVLSACNTAAGDGAGAEAISGLGRAFFYAGAKSILVSNWPVHSDATRALMTTLFKDYASRGNNGRAKALQKAMIRLLEDDGYRTEDNQTLFSYAHPIFWAPFTLVGDGA
jgi:CHAT domain-containing protein